MTTRPAPFKQCSQCDTPKPPEGGVDLSRTQDITTSTCKKECSMTIECHNSKCKNHSCNSGDPRDEGPFCYEQECVFEPLTPAGYTEEELERDSPYNQWMHE